ncbi:hypothetical protein PG991_012393 [Apiospora marii]|uniref:Uncharacterized protein n=1 Tax=Apiospora marii TaxID=335849 RepID=A0ABR1R9P4_9PEZI
MAVAIRPLSIVLRTSKIPLRHRCNNNGFTRSKADLFSTTTASFRAIRPESNAPSSKQRETPKTPPKLLFAVDDGSDAFDVSYRHLEGLMTKYSQRLKAVIYPYVPPRKTRSAEYKKPRETVEERAKEYRKGLLKSLNLLKTNKQSCLQSAESRLLKYWRSLDMHRPQNSKDAVERAKAILANDNAGRLVSRWIGRTYVHRSLDHFSLSNPSARHCLSIAMHILVGAGEWRRLDQWLRDTAKKPDQGDHAANKRLQLRCHLITGMAQAIRLWEPDVYSSDSSDFLKLCMKRLGQNMDIAPLVKRAFEERNRLAPANEFLNIQNMLSHSRHGLHELVGALELQMAVFEMYRLGRFASPWEFKDLMRNIHANIRHPLRLGYQPPDMFFRMRTLANDCTELLSKRGETEVANEVLRLTNEVYIS